MKSLNTFIYESIMITEQRTHYIVFNKDNVERFKSDDNMLKHARTDDDVHGFILLNQDDELVSYIAWQNDFIIAFETMEKYRNHGYGTRLLKKAVKNGVTKLSVNKSNINSINMYINFGFEEYKEDDNMFYMKIGEILNENLKKIDNVVYEKFK